MSIRDPSDGTVKENPELNPIEHGIRRGQEILDNAFSGLPFGSTKPENLERLERSRAKLKRYHETGVWDDL